MTNVNLSSYAQFFNQTKILFTTAIRDVLKMSLALANQLQQAATGSKIVLILLHMSGQFSNPLGHYADLHGGRAGISLMRGQIIGDFSLLLTGDHS